MRHLLPALLLLAMPACSSSSSTSSASAGGGDSVVSICSSDPRAMVYTSGLSATATDGAMKATFVTADPAPPLKGYNTWTLKIVDAHGSPVSGATITAKPWMPDHAHGASVTPLVTSMGGGTYQVGQLDLFMPGIWQVTLTITPTSGPADSVMFSFCIDG